MGSLGYGIGLREPHSCRHRYPAEVVNHAVWLYFRYPLSLRLVEERLAERGSLELQTSTKGEPAVAIRYATARWAALTAGR